MSGMRAMFKKDLREMLATPSSYMGLVLALSYITMMVLIAVSDIKDFSGQGKRIEEVVVLMQRTIDATTFALALMATLGLCLGVANVTVVFEKRERTLESLLATPSKMRQVWRAKTATLALVCIPLGTLLSMGTVYALCNWAINPQLSAQVWPASSAVVGALVVVPLVMYFLLDIYVGLQFVISNHRFSNILFIVLLFGAVALNMIFQSGDESLPRYVLMGAVALGLWLADLWLATFVTTERVILTGKG